MTEPRPDWFLGELRERPGPGKAFYTTRRYPLFYLQITKCGCTFLRNLLYHLDHGHMHGFADRIHSHENDFLKADLIPRQDLVNSPFLFAVVRDPADRFLSLYFDKLANRNSRFDKKMRERVAKGAGLNPAPDPGLRGHRENAAKALEWIGRNLDRREGGRVNPHWQRQSVRLSRAKGLDARLLTLDGLSWQLPELLEPIIPDIREQMDAVRVRNRSQRPHGRDEMLTPGFQAMVDAVYAEDAAIYRRASETWANRAPNAG
ncbi:MAG: sulfotransferase family 2 domain-containing protein [Paracoccaceae bacterium]